MPSTRSEIISNIAMIENKDRLSAEDYGVLNALRTELAAAPESPKSSYAELLATAEPFRRWLRRQPAERRFRAAHTCNCPLAEFLTEESGRRTEVGVTDVQAPAEGPPYYLGGFWPIPPWGRSFINAVDATVPPGSTYEISPAECLALLRKVEAASR